MKIGIMGGTFDPIHNGHLMLGEYAYKHFGLDQVWFMPNGNPPHKRSSSIESDAKMRTEMVALAIKEVDYFQLEKYEVEYKGVSYTYKTMEYFHQLYKEDQFYFIIGADSLFAIETWVHPERIFPNCTILAAYRGDINKRVLMEEKIRHLKEKFHAEIELLHTPLFHVSSRELRERMKKGISVEGYIPKSVESYIKVNGLYKEE